MTIHPTDAAQPAQTAPPPPAELPRRNRRGLGIAAFVVGSALVLTGAGVVGNAAFELLDGITSRPPAINGESENPGHHPTMPDLSVDGLEVTPATDAQKIGVVTILTDLLYDDESQAAGTGSILTEDGQVLTNNHVIEGSTYIEVTVESTGETYDAIVLGTDKTNDVALLQLEDAEDLDTVDLSSTEVEIGDLVASIGNAQGTGDLVTAEGRVTSVGESLSIGDGFGGEYENLVDLIEVDADVVSGDSGGPLVDDEGDVVGMVTAASGGTSDIRGYAITIDFAMSVVDAIRAGEESDTIHIGPSAFIGVTLDPDQGSTGITLNGSIEDTPGDRAGLGAGDIITAIDGVQVRTIDELKAIIREHDPGDVIDVTYFDEDGAEQTVELTLTEGPA